jgi:hypothetical protein
MMITRERGIRTSTDREGAIEKSTSGKMPIDLIIHTGTDGRLMLREGMTMLKDMPTLRSVK